MIDHSTLLAAGLQCEQADDVVTITLNRPNVRNAQTPAMWAALAEIGSSLTGDARIVVLRGAGRAFSSGLDRNFLDLHATGDQTLSGIAALPEAEALERIAGYQRAFSWLSRPDIVSIAAVQGPAVGAGFQLALACDLRIAADDVAVSLPEGTLGLVPDLGGTHPLVRAVGVARALEICLTGRVVLAPEALRLGLVNLVVERTELDAAVADCVAAIRATPRTAATELKALLSAALGQTAQQQMATEREAQVRRLKEGAGNGD